MELKRPGFVSILGLVLAIIGLYLFLGLDTSPVLIPHSIQIMPIIGGVILGIGFSLMFFDRNIITTGIGFVVFLAMAIVNWVSAGFALGLLVPGLWGKAKSLPVYLAAIILFIGLVMVVSQNPIVYQDEFINQIVDITYENMGAMQEGMQSMMEQEIESMIPTREQINTMVATMLPCDNQTYREQCIQAREALADQMYQQTHSPEYKQELLSRLPKIQITRTQIRQIIAEMPMIHVILKNIQYIVALISTGWFLLYSMSITVPMGILDFFLGFIPKKKESEEELTRKGEENKGEQQGTSKNAKESEGNRVW